MIWEYLLKRQAPIPIAEYAMLWRKPGFGGLCSKTAATLPYPNSPNVTALSKTQTVWIFSAISCLLATAIAFVFFDDAIVKFCGGNIGKLDAVSQGLGTAVVLSVDAGVALTLILVRIVRGKEGFPPLFRVLVLACITSICAFAVNDSALKLLFGVPNPAHVLLQGAQHGFHFLAGSRESSFPSGHMILASSFAGVFMRLYSRAIVPLAALLFIAAVALIVGDWHFVSDVIAGTSLGIGAGILVGDLWLDHTRGMTAS